MNRNMKLLVLTLFMVVAIHARPDVSEITGGYNYNNPGVGINVIGSGTAPSGSYIPSSIGGNGINLIGSGNTPSGSYLPGTGSNILGGSVNVGGQGNFQNGHQDQKSVYFYAAPDDEGPARLKINIAPSSHKNTKVIFIKAPGGAGVIPEVIAPPSQAEDKTVVYVLVRKQEQGGAITIPSSVGVKSAKPEVYFIKYKTQQEAEQAVATGLQGQSVGSGLSDLGNQGAFVRVFKDEVQQGGTIGGGGDISGSSILGGSVGGGGGSIGVTGNIGGGPNYGVPGASGPY